MNAAPPKHRFLAPELVPPLVPLPEAEAHHALHVLRLRAGERVELFDGRGNRAVGTLAVGKHGLAEVAISAVEGPSPRPPPHVTLSAAPPKGKRLDWLLEKASELGVARLEWLLCERSVAVPGGSESARRRWEGICGSAVRQSGQVWLPELAGPAGLAEVLARGPRGVGLIAHGGPGTPPLAEAFSPAGGDEVHILVGPEGGWTEGELASAIAAGFRPARLGGTTLRVETACVALVAGVLALHEAGRP